MRAPMTWRAWAAMVAFPAVSVAQDTTAAKASLLAADRAAASSEAALRRVMAPRAVVLLGGFNILHGAAAFGPHLAQAAPARGAWTPVHAVVSADGTFGCTTGVLHRTPADSTQASTGRYASCWRRARGGRWRLLALSIAVAPPSVRTLPDSIAAAPGSTGVSVTRERRPRRQGAGAARPAQAMADADRAFGRFSADSGGPAGAFSRWVADDGMMLGARATPVRGPAQVRQAFAAYPATGRFEWAPVDSLAAASRDGSLGFTVGEARNAPTPASVSYSKYLTVWRREPNGSYRWIFDIGSDRPAPAR
jgi:ketosteroid isomerase-like protein